MIYTYDVKTNTGEAPLHDNALTVFVLKKVLKKVSETKDETSEIWFTNPGQGRYWLRNILKEWNFIISRGKGPAKQVAMISVVDK